MPVAGQRDPEATRKTLVEWLARKLPGARDVEITALEIPQASGFSNETFLFDALWREGGEQRARLVLRAQPQSYGLFPTIDILRQQFLTMQKLGEQSDVPVARVRFAEPDPDVLGQPFFVMDRVEGQVPGDNPPHTVAGFLLELDPASRRKLHLSGLDAMTRVHRVDWRRIGFEHLDRPEFGARGREQLQGYLRHYHDWAVEGAPHAVLDPARAWLDAHWPRDDARVDLCWGDARIGNQMFRELCCVAVFDWEMASLANAESDLGWWLFMQRFHTEGAGVPLPEGMLSRAETIAIWEEKVGRRAEHVDFYEVLGGYHFCIVMVMLAKNMLRLLPGGFPADFGVTNPGAVLLRKLLAEGV